MICYNDRTYCVCSCREEDCPDKLTVEVAQAAIKAGMFISATANLCGKYSDNEEVN